MPKRSNKFQKIAHLMQRILATGAGVTESALLKDSQTGSSVEVDILIKAEVGGTELNVGIECRDRSRPATVEWVRETKGKHEHLPVNKSVLISSSGFTAEAIRKAKALGIDTLTIDEAESTEWCEYLTSLDDLRFAGFSVSIIQTKIKVVNQSNLDSSNFEENSILFDEKSGFQGTVKEYSTFLVRSEEAMKLSIEKWLENKEKPSSYQPTINYTPETPMYIFGSDGAKHLVRSIHCKVTVSVNETNINMKPGRVRDSNFAICEVEDVFTGDQNRNFLIVSKEEDGEIGSGLILTPEGDVRETKRNETSKKASNKW